MKSKQLLEIITSLSQKYIDFLLRAVSLESPTANREAVNRAGDIFVEAAGELGFSVLREEMTGAANPISITMNEHSQGAPIVFSGHIDTVHPVGIFGEGGIYERDGELHGPGAYDCKGGCVAALMAMEALSIMGYKDRPVKLILQTDEEMSSAPSEKRTVDFMEREAAGCVAFLNCEPSMPGEITLMRKGILRYEIEVVGVAGHSSKCYLAKSAILEAAHKIIRLEGWKDKDGITVSCGKISGGTTANTVPERCSFVIDIRYKNGEQREEIVREVKRICDTSYTCGTTATARLLSERVAMERTDKNERLVGEVNRIFELYGIERVTPVMRTAGSDASDMTSRGICALDGFGVRGGYIHSTREYAFSRSVAEAAYKLSAVAMEIRDNF